MQGGIQLLTQTAITGTSSEILYITNDDPETIINLSDNFTLPFEFDGNSVETNVTQINLAEYFIASIKHAAEDNNSLLFGITIIDNKSTSEVIALADEGKVDFWLEIGEHFSTGYELGFSTNTTLHYLSGGILGPSIVQGGLFAIAGQEPFTIVTREKTTILGAVEPILLGGESDSGFNLGTGLAGFIAILLAVIAPAPFISTSFAGEREKKTMEALLALPLSRRSILVGKLTAGMVLVSVFSLMNLVGMFLYNFIIESISEGPISGSGVSLAIDLNLVTITAITIAMFLSAFIAIGFGISIASLSKDVRTSESLYSFIIMIPSLIIGMVGMFGGVPESFGEVGFILYIIPWSHSLSIFQKIMRPEFYNVKAIFGVGNLWIDLLFHIFVLVLMIGIILYIASKIFEREGIVN
jgi:ABC-type transport system involved in multi-copper enzyme maturation permease subunit